MNELELIELAKKYFKPGPDILVGPGDDCAVINVGTEKLLLLAVDQLVSGIHYDPVDTAPEQAAKKLLRRNLSDIAAMGGKPATAVLAVALNMPGTEQRGAWLEKFFKSLAGEARQWDMSVCGGDISSLPSEGAVFSLAITGYVSRDHLCLRSGARPGNRLVATGSFGNSLDSGRHIDFLPRVEEGSFIASRNASAMIDVSDGLLSDSAKIAAVSGCSLLLYSSEIPLNKYASLEQALNDGEDYELLAAVPEKYLDRLVSEWEFDAPLTVIGEFRKGAPGRIADSKTGREYSPAESGYEHFNP